MLAEGDIFHMFFQFVLLDSFQYILYEFRFSLRSGVVLDFDNQFGFWLAFYCFQVFFKKRKHFSCFQELLAQSLEIGALYAMGSMIRSMSNNDEAVGSQVEVALMS